MFSMQAAVEGCTNRFRRLVIHFEALYHPTPTDRRKKQLFLPLKNWQKCSPMSNNPPHAWPRYAKKISCYETRTTYICVNICVHVYILGDDSGLRVLPRHPENIFAKNMYLDTLILLSLFNRPIACRERPAAWVSTI